MTTDSSQPTDWFRDARFGLFIHWGLYSLLGGQWRGQTMEYIGEWTQARFRIPNTEIEKLAADFHATDFDADLWIASAKRAGMRYLVFTAKHHEGFAMFKSRVDPFNIVDATPFARDPLKELAVACRRHGLRLGIYYSQDLDWHHPDGGDPGPKFPKNGGMSWGNDWDFPDLSVKRFDRYFDGKALPQVRELLTNYGPVDLIWFDCPVSMSRSHSERLMKLVRQLQPQCLINSRIGHGLGDFGSLGDNEIPAGRLRGLWETPATLNDTWGFKFTDHNWKSAADTLGILCGLAEKDVNYLLNIGPQPDGRFPSPAMKVLQQLGDWMDRYGEAIHGTRGSPFGHDFDWGWITTRAVRDGRPARLYLILKQFPGRQLLIRGLQSRVRRAYELSAPTNPVEVEQRDNRDVSRVPELRIHLPAVRPSLPSRVIALELDGDAKVDARMLAQQGEMIMLPAASGELRIRSLSPSSVAAEQTELVGAAGEQLPANGTPQLQKGVLLHWLSIDDWIEWELVACRSGSYSVEVTTSSGGFNRPWQGNHQVRLELAGRVIAGQLHRDELLTTPETRCYPRAVSRLGTVALASGTHRAVLRASKIEPNDGLGIALVSLRLRRLDPPIQSVAG